MRYQQTTSRRRIPGPKGGRSTCIKTLLQCQYHGQYSGSIVAMTREPVGPCPQCTADNDWYYKAVTALRQEGLEKPTHAQILARGEEMAGRPLLRRIHG